jgi:hypothetical protein
MWTARVQYTCGKVVKTVKLTDFVPAREFPFSVAYLRITEPLLAQRPSYSQDMAPFSIFTLKRRKKCPLACAVPFLPAAPTWRAVEEPWDLRLRNLSVWSPGVHCRTSPDSVNPTDALTSFSKISFSIILCLRLRFHGGRLPEGRGDQTFGLSDLL